MDDIPDNIKCDAKGIKVCELMCENKVSILSRQKLLQNCTM